MKPNEQSKDLKSNVSPYEGFSLVLNGAKSRVKDMFLSVIKHPIATMGAIAGVALLSSLAPMIGVSSGAVIGALGLAYFGASAFNFSKNVVNAVSDGAKKDNEKLRTDLTQIGSSGVDLALSALPKTLKTNYRNVKYQLKYGKIGVRKDIVKFFKNADGLKAKYNALSACNMDLVDDINRYAGIDELQKQLKFSNEVKKEYLDLYNIKDRDEFIKTAYDRLCKDLGYKGKGFDDSPVLKFVDDESPSICASYKYSNNSVIINNNHYEPDYFDIDTKMQTLATLRHELQHYQQVVDMARASDIDKSGYLTKSKDTYASVSRVAKRQGRIKKHSKAYNNANACYDNFFKTYNSGAEDLSPKGSIINKIRYHIEYLKYMLNPIERDAIRAESIITPVDNDILMPLLFNPSFLFTQANRKD